MWRFPLGTLLLLDSWEENKDKCGGPPPPAPKEHENSVYHTNPLL